MEKLKGYLIIPIWILISICTTALLLFNAIISPFRKKNMAKPHFSVRTICEVANDYRK